jgi:hypothetical protein
MMKMTFSIPPVKQYTAPPIKIQSLANIQTNATASISNTILIGSIFQPIYNTGPCSSCGK